MLRIRKFPWMMVSLLFTGCGPEDTTPTPTPYTPEPTAEVVDPTPEPTPALLTYYRDVAPILNDNCLSCHQSGSVAPFELATYEQVRDLGSIISTSVQSRSMPPMAVDNDGSCNTFKDVRWLTQAQIDTITQWAAGPRVAGDPADAPPPWTPPDSPIDVSATLDIGAAYVPDSSREDDYRCFVVEPGLEADQFVTGYHIRPENLNLVHHVLVYSLYSEDDEVTVTDLDAAEEGPGYTCFGGPGANGILLAAWAPGMPATHFPEDTGLKITAGRAVVVQIHYNTIAGEGSDRTQIDLEWTSTVRYEAQMILSGDYDMVLPGGRQDAWTFTEVSPADLGAPIDVTVWAMAPHMHTLGRRMDVDIFDSKGGVCGLRAPRYDFNWQQLYWLEKPLVVQSDDIVRITCHYDTRERDQMVAWGEGTSDEMCLATFYLTFGKNRDAVDPETTGFEVPYSTGAEVLGEAPARLWSGSAGGVGADHVRGLVLGEGGEITVAGYSNSAELKVGEENLPLAGGNDGFIVRYNQSREVMWAHSLGGTSNDSFLAMAERGDGGVVVGGAYESTDLDVGQGPIVTRGGQDIWVASYTSDGLLTWVKTFGGPRDDTAYGIAVGPNGEIFVGGIYRDTAEFGGVSLISRSDSYNGFLMKLTPEGEVEWARSFGSTYRSVVRALDVGADGELALVGYFSETADLGQGDVTSLGSWDGMMGMYNSEDGTPRWITTFGNIYQDTVRAVRVDPDGNVFAGGYFTGTLDLGQGGPEFMGSTDAFVVKFNQEGQYQWSQSLGNVAGDNTTGLAADASGVYIGAQVEGSSWVGGGELGTLGKTEVSLVHLGQTGEFQWARRLGGRGSDSYPHVAARDGTLVTAWAASGPVEVEGVKVEGEGDYDVVVLEGLIRPR